MSMINAVIRQHRATQVFFDCRDAAPDPADQRKIEQAIALSIALGEADDDGQPTLPLAA
jgi:hypothetical protein